jgi:hypothetical protein
LTLRPTARPRRFGSRATRNELPGPCSTTSLQTWGIIWPRVGILVALDNRRSRALRRSSLICSRDRLCRRLGPAALLFARERLRPGPSAAPSPLETSGPNRIARRSYSRQPRCERAKAGAPVGRRPVAGLVRSGSARGLGRDTWISAKGVLSDRARRPLLRTEGAFRTGRLVGALHVLPVHRRIEVDNPSRPSSGLELARLLLAVAHRFGTRICARAPL